MVWDLVRSIFCCEGGAWRSVTHYWIFVEVNRKNEGDSFCYVQIRELLCEYFREILKFKDYESEHKGFSDLSEEDQFLAQLVKIERFEHKIKIMSFMATFDESADLLEPVEFAFRDFEISSREFFVHSGVFPGVSGRCVNIVDYLWVVRGCFHPRNKRGLYVDQIFKLVIYLNQWGFLYWDSFSAVC